MTEQQWQLIDDGEYRMDRVCIAVILGELINPRIEKRLSAEQRMADVHLISWDRGTNMLLRPNENGYKAHSILLRAKSDPVRRMIPYARFVRFAIKELKSISPAVIHVQNLDMLKIAVWYKHHVNQKVHIIYEIADLHKLLVDKQKSLLRKIAQRHLRNEDRKCTQDVDLLVVTSEMFYNTYFKDFMPAEKLLYMPNVPDITAFKNYQRKAEKEPFVVGFIGAVRYKQQMKNLIEAGKKAGVKVLFAGVEYEGNELELLCRDEPHVTWYGKFDFTQKAAALYGMCDAIYSVYNADLENVKVALPNKLYEAIYCELPLIVAKDTYLSELVTKWGVGVSVRHDDVNELADMLVRLKNDKAFYQQICQHCHEKKEIVNLECYNEKLLNRIQVMLSEVG